jgi:hypothetical protein
MSDRTRKVLYVVSIALVTPFALLGAAVFMWWLTTNGNASVNVFNRSGTTLHNVVVSSNGFSGPSRDVFPGGDFAFSADTQMSFRFSLAFDANGKHYDAPAHLWLPPFGDYIVSAYIDDKLTLSVGAKSTFMYR